MPVVIAGLLLIAVAVSLTPLAGAAPAPPTLSLFGPWVTTGSQVAFVAKIRNEEGLWTEKFGSKTPKRIAPAYCGPKMEEVDQLALGPKGSVACLEATTGNTEASYTLDFVTSSGAITHVASAGGPTGDNSAPVGSISVVFGDSAFLGYLRVTAKGVTQLMRITSSGHAQHIADLSGVSTPRAVAIDSGHIAITDGHTVEVYTVAGQQVSTFAAGAASAPSVGIRKDRVVVRTTAKTLVAYTLQGQIVHSYPIRVSSFANGLATYGGYAVYLGANKAVHAVKLSSGVDRILARSGKGWFFSGVSLQAPGVVAPLTSPGRNVPVKLVFVSMAKIRAALG